MYDTQKKINKKNWKLYHVVFELATFSILREDWCTIQNQWDCIVREKFNISETKFWKSK